MKVVTLNVKVVARREEATDILSFDLADAAGAALPPFSAGAHIDVHIGPGLIRQYSLCNDPADGRSYRIAVLKEAGSRGGSKALHERAHAGDMLEISAPRNHFALSQEARSSLLIAGGIGITPIMAMAECLSRAGSEFELHYCARTPARAAFRDQLVTSRFASRVAFHFDDGDEAQRFDIRTMLQRQPAQTHLYVCGPGGFMNAVLSAAREIGWSEEQLHYEFFGAEATTSAKDQQSFEVMLSSSGKRVRVPAEQSVVEALAAVGVAVPTSCSQGVCGTCLTRVLKGEPEHLDLYLTPQEQARNDQFLPCCSRSRSPCLVLDL